MLFRVRLFGRLSFWPRRLVRSSAESTTGKIHVSLAFSHAMDVRLSRRLRSGVPHLRHIKCVLIACDGWDIYSITR